MNPRPSGTVVAGRYRITALLGRGAQALVYSALDLVVDRIVALKIFHGEATEGDRRRFLQGPRPQLLHPNILRVLEHGSTPDDLYLITEFIDGATLARILQQRPRLEPDYAIEIAIRVGLALTYAHWHGVVHRDVKPSNIMVSTDGVVLLSDFDLVTDTGAATLTPGGMIVGTPRYMSPEQASGMPLDARSDIFSLGAVLYEALAGRPWWSVDGESPAAAEVLRRIVEQPPCPLRDLLPDLPEAVDLALRTSLAKNPGDRYDSADDFVNALLPSPAVPLASLLARPGAEDAAGTRAEIDHPTVSIPAYLPQSEQRLREFAALWDEIADAALRDRRRFIALTDTLVRGLLREAIGYRIGDAIAHFQGTVGCMVEAPFLWIRQSRFPLLFVNTAEAGDVFSTILQQLAVARTTEYFAVLVVVPPPGAAMASEAERLRNVVEHSIYRHDFVVLDREHLASIIAHNSSMRLIEIIVEQVDDLSVLSPYVVRGPVPDQMFFGREGEIKVISQSMQRGDHALVGGRRIGKSSTLLRLKRLLGDDQRYRPVYMDCEPLFSCEDFLGAVGEHADIVGGADPLLFRKIALRLRDASAPATVVFLLDEIDELLACDAARRPAAQLFKTFRSASQEGLCRFVFAGSRTLFHHLRNPRSPFFNFCDALTLRRLDDRSVAEIVRKPMRQLGIDMADETRLIQRITAVTSCHPNLAQWLCDRLVRFSVARRLSPSAPAEIVSTPEFRDHYLSTAWGDATPLEKLISLTMSDPSFAVEDVLKSLAPYGIRNEGVVREALDFLNLCCLLDHDGAGGFRFGLECFPEIARQGDVLSGAVESLAMEARQQCS
jgi:hypothetical protein